MTFYNTNSLFGSRLRSSIAAAERQEDAVLALFRACRGMMTPSQVQNRMAMFGKHWPITSIRRAMTVLTDEHKLEKTDTLREGPFGAPEHAWRRACQPAAV